MNRALSSMHNTLSPRIRARARALHPTGAQTQNEYGTALSCANSKAVDLQPGSEVDCKRFDELFDLEVEIQPRCVLWKSWTLALLLLVFSAALVTIALTNAFQAVLPVDFQQSMKTKQDPTSKRTTNTFLEETSPQGDPAFGLWEDRNTTGHAGLPSENRNVPPTSRPSEKERKRSLRRYPTIDRSILAKFGGLDPDGIPGERELDVLSDGLQPDIHPKARDASRRWPTILHIPEGRTSQKASFSTSKKSTFPIQPDEPPVICGPDHPSGRTCRFLLPLRMAEQESKARIHFTQIAQLAARLNRILVLPNVGKSRMGACYKYPFDTYYDTTPFFTGNLQTELELKDPGYVTLDDFRLWSEAAGGHTPLQSRLSSVAASVPQTILDSAEKSLDDTELTTHQYPTELARESQFPGCFPSKWPQLLLEETSLFIALEEHQPVSPTPDFGELIATHLNNWSTIAGRGPQTEFDGQEPLPAVAMSDGRPDVLIVNWELRRPVFPPSPSDPSLQYSLELQDLATKLAPSGPYLAIHWRMETVETDVLEDCAHALVDAISSNLHDTGHLGSGIEQVWFASDYPYPLASSFDDSSTPGKVAKSGTFKTFGDQHQAAVKILRNAFEEGEELERWELVDISRSIELHAAISSAQGELLKDTGVLGILDKLIVTKADLFVGGSRRCSRQSSFTRQVIESRQKSWKDLRNVVTAF